MKSLVWVLALAAVSCGTPVQNAIQFEEGLSAKTYAYKDVSGEYECTREIKKSKAKLATRTSLISAAGRGNKLVEKTFVLSEIGSVRINRGRATAIRPMLSQHTTWLEGKRYFSQMKLNPASKKLDVLMQSPEGKWNGKQSLSLPKGRIFCFYSQLPECLLISGLLDQVSREKKTPNFYVVWDSYPYHQEHFNGLGQSAFAYARLVLEKRGKSSMHYNVELSDQVLSLHFTDKGNFVRQFWTSQGISLIPPSEAEDSVEKL